MALSVDVCSLAESLSTSYASNSGRLTAAQVYRTGRVLCCAQLLGDGVLVEAFDRVISSLPELRLNRALHSLNYAFASVILSDGGRAAAPLRSFLVDKPQLLDNVTWRDVTEGAESLIGIYLSSDTVCRSACLKNDTTEVELSILCLAWVYDGLSPEKGNESGLGLCGLILRTIEKLLVRALVGGLNTGDDDERLACIMNSVQTIQSNSGDHNCALGDMLAMEGCAVVDTLESRFALGDGSQPAQLQYLLAMLRASPKGKERALSPPAPSIPVVKADEATEPEISMTDMQIEQVRNVLDGTEFGDGYIEEALKCYSHDVERTIEALFQVAEGSADAVHPRLRAFPKNLPRAMKESVHQYTANVSLHRGMTAQKDDMEHVRRQKHIIKEAEREAEEEAFLVSQALSATLASKGENDDQFEGWEAMKDSGYEDDYDDQYDGIGNDGGAAGGIGGLDEGLYDVDEHNVHQKYDRGGAKKEQEMWRKYNSIIKDVDSESRFWEDNQNLNRVGNGSKNNQNKYRGPDKGKGGRVIGPDGKYLPIQRGKKGRGGGVQNSSVAGRGKGQAGRGDSTQKGEQKSGEELSKIQKRRKNDNKAKIGNHHRKDRANKKASGGMVM